MIDFNEWDRFWMGFLGRFKGESEADVTARLLKFRAGRFPGIHEEPMSHFKFNLGCAVVLITSLAQAVKEKTEQDYELELAADRHAEKQRNEYLSRANRPDLRSDRPNKLYPDGYGGSNRIIGFAKIADVVERGQVVGRSDYVNAPPSYLVRYRAADGKQTEAWFSEDAIAHDPAAPIDHDITTATAARRDPADCDNSDRGEG